VALLAACRVVTRASMQLQSKGLMCAHDSGGDALIMLRSMHIGRNGSLWLRACLSRLVAVGTCQHQHQSTHVPTCFCLLLSAHLIATQRSGCIVPGAAEPYRRHAWQ
jgi:hypothetical protein